VLPNTTLRSVIIKEKEIQRLLETIVFGIKMWCIELPSCPIIKMLKKKKKIVGYLTSTLQRLTLPCNN
jgi:hypothetical protein